MFFQPFQHVSDQVSGTCVNLGELWMWERPQRSQLEFGALIRGREDEKWSLRVCLGWHVVDGSVRAGGFNADRAYSAWLWASPLHLYSSPDVCAYQWRKWLMEHWGGLGLGWVWASSGSRLAQIWLRSGPLWNQCQSEGVYVGGSMGLINHKTTDSVNPGLKSVRDP